MSEEALDEDDGVWLRACAASDLEPGQAVAMPLTPPVAVFNVDGEFFATDDTCTHAESSLADGYIDDDIVECAFHFAKFSIKTGAALTPPACMALKTYPVRLRDGDVYVDISGHGSA
jgi:3-phenylpropionate/trans-cinnamate dioxygenase ferredoxin subunit